MKKKKFASKKKIGRPRKIIRPEKASPTLSFGPVPRGAKWAVFLDRDGVINEHREDHVKTLDEFRFIPGSVYGMKLLSRAGYMLFIISNQSGVGKGVIQPANLAHIDSHMEEVFRANKIKMERIFYCLHKPDEGCECRKPSIKFLTDAEKEFGIELSRSFVVGDNTKDIKMGIEGGCRTVLLKTGLAGKDGCFRVKPDFKFENLLEAAKKISGYDE